MNSHWKDSQDVRHTDGTTQAPASVAPGLGITPLLSFNTCMWSMFILNYFLSYYLGLYSFHNFGFWAHSMYSNGAQCHKGLLGIYFSCSYPRNYVYVDWWWIYQLVFRKFKIQWENCFLFFLMTWFEMKKIDTV